MMEMFERALVVVVLTFVAAGAAVRGAALLGGPMRALPPRHRVLFLEAALALPWVLPALVVGAALAPSLLALLWPGLDHCAAHDDVHDHFCLLHPPHPSFTSWLVALCLLSVLPVGARILRAAQRLARAHVDIAALRRAARAGDDGTMRVPTDLPLCAVVGLTRPAILLSDGARSRVSPQHLSVMLAHERAHVARRDVPRHALALLAASALGPDLARSLLSGLAIAREQACDEAAAEALGDRSSVAEAIVRTAGIFGAHPALPDGAAAAFGPDAIESRVTSLLADPVPLPRLASAAVLAAVVLTAAALPAVHHVLETLLGALLH